MAGAMSFAQIEKLWTDNGGNAAFAPLFAAIAEAESGGNPTALNNNPSTGDYSVGLWQINYYGTLLPGRTAEFGSPASLQGNANAQAKAAIQLSNNGTNLGPWKGDPVASAALAGQPIPAQYTQGAAVSTAGLSTSGLAGPGPNGAGAPATCTPVIGEGGILGIGSVTLLNSCQAAEILGAMLIVGGGILLVLGFGLVMADFGLSKGVAPVIQRAIGSRATTRSANQASQRRVGEQTQIAEARASARRSTTQTRPRSYNSEADRERFRREGFPGDS